MPTVLSNSPKKKCKIVVIGDGSVGKTCLLYSYAHQGVFLTEHIPSVFNNFETNIEYNDGGEKGSVHLALWDTAGQEEYTQLRQLCYGGKSSNSNSDKSNNKDLYGEGSSNSNSSCNKNGNAQMMTAVAATTSPVSSANESNSSSSTASDDVSVFLVCFAWNNIQSFTNVEMKWSREIRQVAQDMQRRSMAAKGATAVANAPRPFSVILVGTKSDLKPKCVTAAAAGTAAHWYGANNAGAMKTNALVPGKQLSTSDAELLRRKMGADAFVDCSALTGEGVRDVFDAALKAWYEKKVARAPEMDVEPKRRRFCTIS